MKYQTSKLQERIFIGVDLQLNSFKQVAMRDLHQLIIHQITP